MKEYKQGASGGRAAPRYVIHSEYSIIRHLLLLLFFFPPLLIARYIYTLQVMEYAGSTPIYIEAVISQNSSASQKASYIISFYILKC